MAESTINFTMDTSKCLEIIEKHKKEILLKVSDINEAQKFIDSQGLILWEPIEYDESGREVILAEVLRDYATCLFNTPVSDE